jgi:hypothetical protein
MQQAKIEHTPVNIRATGMFFARQEGGRVALNE